MLKDPRLKKTLLTLIVTIAVAIYGFVDDKRSPDTPVSTHYATADAQLQDAYSNRQSDIQVKGSGRVDRLLPDDRKGSRHQRFILRLASGQKLLVAHNIDLAPKITSIRRGDIIEFNGEYEYNPKGGVLHWTHRDPGRRHEDGWLRHQGKTYQ